MKKRILLLAALEVLLLLAGVYFEPTHCVRGRLGGEPFYDGKPTSWWRKEFDSWHRMKNPAARPNSPERIRWTYGRRLSKFEELKFHDWKFWNMDGHAYQGQSRVPAILGGDLDAKAVLNELKDDARPRVRSFARIGLGMGPDIDNPVE